jgi:SAM-dependent methyltransferase
MSPHASPPAAHDSPSAWMVANALRVAHGASLLDVACGYGRNAVFFAARGAHVTAVDRNEDAINRLQSLPNIDARLIDIEGDGTASAWPFAPSTFDAVIVCNYLWRPTFAAMLASLKPGGVLLYETFMRGNERYGKPSRAEFLLDAGELGERLEPQFEIVAAFEGDLSDANGAPLATKAMVAAVKRTPT